MDNDALLADILKSFNKYRQLGFPKAQIFKMMSKTEFALLAFYFFEKQEQEEKTRFISTIEKAEIIDYE